MKKLKQFLFVNTTNKQTFVKNTFWLGLSEVSGRLLKMLLIIYAARKLGADGWGTFSYALSVASLLMIFSDIGLGGLITREIIQRKEGYTQFISTAVFLKNIILVISVFLVILISPSISNIVGANILFPFIAIIFFFDALRELGFSINRASEKMEREMIVKTVMGIVILVTGIILLQTYTQPKSIAIAYAIGSAIGFFSIFAMIRKDIKKIIFNVDKKLFKLILQTTWPFAIITLIGSIMGNTDIFMLGIWRDAKEIGLYSSVQRIQQFIIIIPSMIATASFPIMSRLAHESREQFGIILEKTMTFILIIGIPITAGGVLLANKIVPFIFGVEYIGAVPIFQVLMIMLLASFPLVLLSNAIFSFNKQRELVVAYTLGIVANILINLALIPSFGATGSAIATCISTTIVTIYIWKKMKIISQFDVLSKLGKGIVATLIMTISILLLLYIGTNTFVVMAIASIVYFLVLWILRESIFSEALKIIKK
jgi:O-antigen/teichoic acid export membrane protein